MTDDIEDYNDVRNLIADLRGGVPEKCDFCQEERSADELHPEEAGQWICNACIKRIDY